MSTIQDYYMGKVRELANEYPTFRDFLVYPNRDNYLSFEDEVFERADKQLPFLVAYGSTKGVVVFDKGEEEYVLKFPFLFDDEYEDDEENYPEKDYCKMEADNYDLAEQEGLGEFFAKTLSIGLFAEPIGERFIKSHFPIYVMERADANEDEYDNYSFNYVKSTASDLSDEEILNELNDDNLTNTMLCFKAFYGDVKEIFNLERFILNTGINDLHGENTGFIYDRPVLIDYCGYFE